MKWKVPCGVQSLSDCVQQTLKTWKETVTSQVHLLNSLHSDWMKIFECHLIKNFKCHVIFSFEVNANPKWLTASLLSLLMNLLSTRFSLGIQTLVNSAKINNYCDLLFICDKHVYNIYIYIYITQKVFSKLHIVRYSLKEVGPMQTR